jgi:hypothetical protein
MSRTQAPSPRVLRIGIIQGGAVTAERLIPPGETATIGTSPHCTVTISGPDLPDQQQLFIARRGRYHLCMPEDADLVIKRDDDLKRHHGVCRLLLDERDRGKLQLGDVTVLFQFIDAPPVSAELARRSFRPRLIDEDDPVFLGILSLASAAAAAMMIYVSALPIPTLVTFDEATEYFVHNIQLTTLDVPATDPLVIERAVDAIAATPEPEPLALPEITPDPTPTPAPAPEPRGSSPADREQQRALALQQRRDDVIGQSALLSGLIRSNGESATNVFSGADGLSEAWEQRLGDISGPEVASASRLDLRIAQDQRGRGDGRIGSDLSDGHGTGTGVGVGTDAVPDVAVPTGLSELGPIEGTEEVPSMQAALRSYGKQIRSCYEQRLKENPSLEGRLVLGLVISSGAVVDAYISENTTRDAELEVCATRRARRWRLQGVEDAEATMPFSLTPG